MAASSVSSNWKTSELPSSHAVCPAGTTGSPKAKLPGTGLANGPSNTVPVASGVNPVQAGTSGSPECPG